jgi:urea transporter
MEEKRIRLLRDIYSHIILQYEILQKANERISEKGSGMIGFTSVILGIVLKIFLDNRNPLREVCDLSPFIALAVIVCLFISFTCFLAGTRVRSFTSLISPSFLIEKLKEDVAPEVFWTQFVEGAKSAYERNKEINQIISLWIKTGNIFLSISLAILAVFSGYILIMLK